MRSFEIRTQRIFNNLIKQNQKLVSDSVLKQTVTVSSVQSPLPKVQRLGSRVQRPKSSVQSPSCRVQRLKSSVQRPASNTCVQSPAIPVCHIPQAHIATTEKLSKSTFLDCKISTSITRVLLMLFERKRIQSRKLHE